MSESSAPRSKSDIGPKRFEFRPGLGVAAVFQDEVIILEKPNGDQTDRRDLVEISRAISSPDVDPRCAPDCAIAADYLPAILECKQPAEKFDRFDWSAWRCVRWPSDQSGIRITGEGCVNWNAIREEIENLGYHLYREVTEGSARDLEHFTVASDKSVIAEGKGETTEANYHAALAEGAERIWSSSPNAKPHVVSTEAKLRVDGYVVPEIDVGPKDSYSSDIWIDWNFGYSVEGDRAALPSELVYFDYSPLSHIQSFRLQHTCGLAAGKSVEEAALAGWFEVIERDAYWIAMGCKLWLPKINATANLEQGSLERRLIADLEEQGIRVILLDNSLDWPVHIVQVILEDSHGHMPAFSHGMGTHFSQSKAIRRALLEAIHVRTGVASAISALHDEIYRNSGNPLEPTATWCDPTFRRRLDHLLMDSGQKSKIASDYSVPKQINPWDFVKAMQAKGNSLFYFPVRQSSGLVVVRSYVSGATTPDPLFDRASQRTSDWLERVGLDLPYIDPILI